MFAGRQTFFLGNDILVYTKKLHTGTKQAEQPLG